jgi:uncharacterized RDD family membrane protein YckC
MFAAAWIFDNISQNEEEDTGWIKAVVFVSIWCIYEPVCTTLGATLGNYLMKIRVRQENARGKKINLPQAFVRFIFKFVLGWLSFLTIHFNEERRAIHDMIAGSVMLEKQ